MLQVTDLSVSYGAIQAVLSLSFHVLPGEIVAIIGANGAGKSSVLSAIAGLVTPTSGSILFEGQELNRLLVHQRTAHGICLLPEAGGLFHELTVAENLRLGAFLWRDLSSYGAKRERIFTYFPILESRLHQKAGTLSGGERQMLAIGRALMMQPKLLMLDEPSLGLAPLVVQKIQEIILHINRKEGTTILLVEQNSQMALSLAGRAYVLETGRIVQEGNTRELADDPAIRDAYLGR